MKSIKSKIKSPIIVAGGAGNPNDLIDLYSKTKCTPVVGNIYNHYENPISLMKSSLLNKFGMALDLDAKKVLLRKIPHGLFICTVREEDEVNGFTASWVTQGSFDPPLIEMAVRAEG